ncbi:MAG: phosphopantothenoylcysteine decarboxylase [Eubacteriaceae bacterium]|nr:phosphopantothenoylcysteine decarboxylase [Eubacteriaceae bacterium]
MGKNILMGITGSIAAYKGADIANNLTKEGYNVRVILSRGGARFITPMTLETLTKNKVYTDVFEVWDPTVVEHIWLAQSSDLVLVAPASADIMAKAACGIADDLLSTALLAVYPETPKLIAPAMNTVMYDNPVTQRNMATLRELGYGFIEPREGHLACGTTGRGALAETELIVETVKKALGD